MPPFRLAALLQYRENLRDQCRQRLAQWLHRDAALVGEQQQRFGEREALLAEIRGAQGSAEHLDVERVIARRYRAGQLSSEIQELASRRREIAEQIALARQELVKADQGVKALEQLRDKARAEYRHSEEKREMREREEIWQAAQPRER
jgi:flagellar biosynthesis chaperone FliJ